MPRGFQSFGFFCRKRFVTGRSLSASSSPQGIAGQPKWPRACGKAVPLTVEPPCPLRPGERSLRVLKLGLNTAEDGAAAPGCQARRAVPALAIVPISRLTAQPAPFDD